ncbi:ribbon-helix-helix domain-containing protein [Patescibacteria group bacterium]|nr:ribbon-helix-helix domain-containing protein [Patescibacteria group bacterium]
MSTLSVPLSDDMLKSLKAIVTQGIAPNMAEAVRQAIRKYLEDQAVEAVLRAEKEPDLKGDLRSLAKKL